MKEFLTEEALQMLEKLSLSKISIHVAFDPSCDPAELTRAETLIKTIEQRVLHSKGPGPHSEMAAPEDATHGRQCAVM